MYEISFFEHGGRINGILTMDATEEAYDMNYLFDIVRNHFKKFYPDKNFVIGIGKSNVFVEDIIKIQYSIELEESVWKTV